MRYISPFRRQEWHSEGIWGKSSFTKQSPSERSVQWPRPRHWAVQVLRPPASVLLAQARADPEIGTAYSLSGRHLWTWLQQGWQSQGLANRNLTSSRFGKHPSPLLLMAWKSSMPKQNSLGFPIILFFIIFYYYTLLLYFISWLSGFYEWALLRHCGLNIWILVINSDKPLTFPFSLEHCHIFEL